MTIKSDLTAALTALAEDVRAIVHGEVELVRAEIRQIGLTYAKAAAGFGVAIVAGLAVVFLALCLAVAGFAWLYAAWTNWSPWAAVFVAILTALVLFGLIAGIAIGLGARQAKVAQAETQAAPGRIKASADQSIAAFHDGIARGQTPALTAVPEPSDGSAA